MTLPVFWTVLRGITEFESEILCKEAILAKFEILFGNLYGGTTENRGEVDSL